MDPDGEMTEDAYIDLDGTVSSPQSSSPVTVTPPDCLAEDLEDGRNQLDAEQLQAAGDCPAPPFVHHLDCLLLAALQQEKLAIRVQNTSHGPEIAFNQLLSKEASSRFRDALRLNDASNTRTLPPSCTSSGLVNSHSGIKRAVSSNAPERAGLWDARKKRKLAKGSLHLPSEESEKKQVSNSLPVCLSGAFRLLYAKGPGSLRRAESLRCDLQAADADGTGTLNEVIASGTPDKPTEQHISRVSVPQELPIIVGSIASPFGGYAPTVPTTPTTSDGLGQDNPSSNSPLLDNIPLIVPPLFENITRAPLSADDAAEQRIAALLERELDERVADSLTCTTKSAEQRSEEEEEERFWTEDSGTSYAEDEAKAWMAQERLHLDKSPSRHSTKVHRAQIASSPVLLDIDEVLLDQVLAWFLEVMPNDDHKTSYSPGDLYDLLSTFPEIRFHAARLLMRYFLIYSTSRGASDDESSASYEDPEALEAVTWDTAVACLALSVKFHRDVLFPLDVIYAHEFIDLAPHELEFDDLERAYRDVLAVVSYRMGSATPTAFMEEVWFALPTLRRLLRFDAGWEDVQKEAWVILLDALQQPDSLRYPVSLITAVAIIEGILEVLSMRYQSTGADRNGKSMRKRDLKSLRKAAIKCSKGVRLDIQDVLQISDAEMLTCRRWLGLVVPE